MTDLVDPVPIGAVVPQRNSQASTDPTGRKKALRCWLGRVGALATAAAVAVVLASLGYYWSLPTVSDAPARVAAILHAHRAVFDPPPVPDKLAAAVVATEDEHFYSNTLVNVTDGFGRAALAALHTSGDPGGSTIAQQLAKQLYGHGDSGLGATLEEIGLGVKLSSHYPKAQLLNLYLNAVYYGNGYWGDLQAARGYFGTDPDRLSWAEAAMLAGVIQAPSAFDPLHHYQLAKQRQQQVLHQLVVNHDISPAQAHAAYQAPLPLT